MTAAADLATDVPAYLLAAAALLLIVLALLRLLVWAVDTVFFDRREP